MDYTIKNLREVSDAAAEAGVSDLSTYLPDTASAITRGSPGAPPGVAVGEELARRLGAHGHPASVSHRDIGR